MYEVLIEKRWVGATNGYVLGDGRLATEYGIFAPPFWRHSEARIGDPDFKRALWEGLSDAEKLAATTRLGGVPV